MNHAPARPQAIRWLTSPAWDLRWVLNGPFLMLLAWGLIQLDPEGLRAFDMVYLVPTALLWLAHRFSALWIAWGSAAYRPIRRAQPGRFYGLPLLLTALCFAWLMLPLPLDPGRRLMILAFVDFAFVTWHFSAQHFGLLRLYRGRARDRGGRRLDRWISLGVGGGAVVLGELLAGTSALLDPWPDLYDGLIPGLAWARWLLASALLVLALPALRLSQPGGHRLYVAQIFSLAIGAALLPPLAFIFAWTIQHWTTAVAVAGRIMGRHQRGWLLAMMITSVILLPWLEIEAADAQIAYAPILWPALSAWIQSSPLIPALVALGFATGFVHYALDRAVFRLSDPEIRRAARHLLEPP